MPRFHLSNLDPLTLTGEEAHHCRDVFRLCSGDEVEVFDGRGNAIRCRIEAVNKGEVRLVALERRSTPPLPVRITLAAAIPKKNMDLIVQKATELGVAEVVPLLTERTVVRETKKTDRWREIALESCKQCGNNWLPEIQPPQKTRDFLASPGKFDLKLIASLQPDAKPLKAILRESVVGRVTSRGVEPAPAEVSGPTTVLLMIGPEGDFTPAELGLAKSAGCLPLSLGPLVLRADTAALYTLSILHHELQNA